MKQLYLAVILLFSISVNSQSPTFDWAKSIGGPNEDHSNSIAVDDYGNVYTSGTFIGIADFDPSAGVFNLSTSSGNQEKYISKLDAAGNFVWALKALGGIVKIDPFNNVILFNEDSIIKLSPSGNIIFRRKAILTPSVSGSSRRDYAIDASGNIYIVGRFSGVVDFNDGLGVDTLRSPSVSGYVLKLDNSCNFIWVKAINGMYDTSYPPFGFGTAANETITTNSSRNIFITGEFKQTVDFDPSVAIHSLSTFTTSFPPPARKFALKLDSLGNFVWVKDIGDLMNYYYIYSTITDGGSFYVTGHDGVGKAILSKLDPNGNTVWSHNLSGGGSFGKSVKTDMNSDVYLIGNFSGNCNFNPGGVVIINSVGSYDGFIAKYDSNGNYILAETFGGSGYASISETDMDGLGNIYITGDHSGTSDFNPSISTYTLTSVAGSVDAFVLKLGNTVIGIKELSKTSSLLVYPNPSNGMVTVKLSSQGNYQLINALGQTIKTFHLNSNNNFTFTMEDLQQGIYYVVGKENNQTVSQKIIVIK